MCLPTQEQKKRKHVLSELKGILSKQDISLWCIGFLGLPKGPHTGSSKQQKLASSLFWRLGPRSKFWQDWFLLVSTETPQFVSGVFTWSSLCSHLHPHILFLSRQAIVN